VARTQPGDLVFLIGSDDKRYLFRLDPAAELHTHRGVLRHEAMIGLPWGSVVETHLGSRYHLFEPSLHDVLLHIRRRSQIVFPKDIGYILLRLSIGPGSTVLEAGTGSGAMTTALAWAVGPTGRVMSFDRRADMLELARRNLERLGLADRVEFRLRDVAEGLEVDEAPAMFMDVRTPHLYLEPVRRALSPGGAFAAIVPTTNQVTDLIAALEANDFRFVEVVEVLLRFYKPVAERLRPTDRMVAHTGYLVFARSPAGRAPDDAPRGAHTGSPPPTGDEQA
jgi:tRNA (adenine57-N1/adenine58-N1)-methyltransferase